jgi:hypothetical protein
MRMVPSTITSTTRDGPAARIARAIEACVTGQGRRDMPYIYRSRCCPFNREKFGSYIFDSLGRSKKLGALIAAPLMFLVAHGSANGMPTYGSNPRIFQPQNGYSTPTRSERLSISSSEVIFARDPSRSRCLLRKKLLGLGPMRINSPSLGTALFHMSSAPPPGKSLNGCTLEAMCCLASCLQIVDAAIPDGTLPKSPGISANSMAMPSWTKPSDGSLVDLNPPSPSAVSKYRAKSAESNPLPTIVYVGTFLRGDKVSAIDPCSNTVRGVAASIRETITSCCSATRVSNAIIVSCCAELIISSNTNKQTVHIDSITTPPITSRVAQLLTPGEYLSDSNIIPAPTAIPANTLPAMSKRWGQKGSAVPESNALIYVSILAVLSWLFALVVAIAALIRSSISLWRERHIKATKGKSQND